ncbi:MAG: class I SAM-dependent methyltransferase [Mesorhizobium sp.]|nr:class I SAM-dependent methyltransferase [Mesorhizobium sp.]MCO5164384.1 class I SAM-dependent methyltransferase [Mesorhizobium sp.]
MDREAGKVESEFDAYRNSYSDAVNGSIAFSGLKVDFFIRAKAARLIDLLSENVGAPKNLSILDVGCGVGTYHPLLAGSVGRITGVDPSAECIAEARMNNPRVDYQAYDGEKIPYPDASFDASFAICVMHHVPVPNWSTFVSEMRRITRPGGVVMLFEHNPYNPLTQRAVSNCPFDADAVLLTMRTAKEYLRASGMTIVEGRYILNVPSITGLARRIDDALGVLPTGAQYYVVARR